MTNRLLKTRADHAKVRGLINENAKTLTLTPAAGALTAGTVGTPYAGVTVAVSNNPVGAALFAVTAGALPPGLTLNANTGAISGTPIAPAGANSFSVTARDELGNTGTNAYTLAVA